MKNLKSKKVILTPGVKIRTSLVFFNKSLAGGCRCSICGVYVDEDGVCDNGHIQPQPVLSKVQK